jgi:hypothetical protein
VARMSERNDVPSARRYWAERLAVPLASAPLFAIAAAAGTAPAAWAAGAVIRRTSRGRRRRTGRCLRCSYDLRATPGRCPACGPIPAEVKT